MKFRVDILEFERGWGNRTDEIKFFDTREEAIKFCFEFNSKNDEHDVPDWYMIADYRGVVK